MTVEYTPQQKQAIDAIVAWYQNVHRNDNTTIEEREFYLAGYAGTGKALPLYEKILTPSGWNTMGDIRVGDFVIGSSGDAVRVSGVFPQTGDRPVYRVHFTDGASVDASEDHLWVVWDKKNRSRVVDTKYLRDANLKNSAGYRLRIKRPSPVKFERQSTPLCPYIYGYILGDGYLGEGRGAAITSWLPDVQHITEMLKKENIQYRISTRGGADVRSIYIPKEYVGEIPRETSHDKKILPEYLYNDIATRKLLLAGLLDSDGTCHEKSQSECKIRFSTMSENLKCGVIELVRSLGGMASCHTKSPRDGEYCVSIRTPFNPFKLPRKAEKWKSPKYNNWAGVKSVEYIGKMPTQCISVDAPDSLYVTKDYILTHNTTIAREVIDTLKKEFGITNIITASYTGKAVDVLRKKGVYNPMTIHSAIYTPRTDKLTKQTIFELSPYSPANTADIIVLDECSMVDRKMAEDLRSFRKPILIMGDQGQLPPISGTGFVSGRKPDFLLEEIHRQVADSPILKLATMARNGEHIPTGVYGDTVLVTDQYTEDTLNKYVLRKGTQPICGANKTRHMLNRIFRKRLGFSESMYPRRGEKLICCQNNAEAGIFNGMMGVAAQDSMDSESHFRKTHVYFNPFGMSMIGDYPSWKALFERTYEENVKEPDFQKGTEKFDFGYALTCHKSQGSEWKTVTVIDESFMFRSDANRWLYTAITRAQEKLVIIQR